MLGDLISVLLLLSEFEIWLNHWIDCTNKNLASVNVIQVSFKVVFGVSYLLSTFNVTP